jgi:ribosomal protein S18 acetylase RimI-like enzyme
MDSTQFAISVRRAQPADAPALAELVNRAYAVEGFFVEGERTNADEITQLVSSGAFLVLEQREEAVAGSLAAAVYVEPRGEGGYIGMLSVDPGFQGQGLGTRLVRIAEAMCEAMGAKSVHLRIVNLREELGRWYRSLGYREVGTAPYDHRPVKQPCHFVEMHKPLAAQ